MSRKFFPIFEHHKQPLISKKMFIKRMIKCIWVAFILLVVSIFIGASVYHYVEGFSWLDGVLNAVMIMTGLGLVNVVHTTAAKIFTTFYAIIAAIIFYMILAILFTPLIHRFLHGFHLEIDRTNDNN